MFTLLGFSIALVLLALGHLLYCIVGDYICKLPLLYSGDYYIYDLSVLVWLSTVMINSMN